MNRNDFLKVFGLAGIGSILPFQRQLVSGNAPGTVSKPNGVACVLVPQETAGPYPLDLSTSIGFRQDITEGRPGMPLKIVFTVVNINNNCSPIPNARLDLWHTDKEGVYSGYAQPGANTVGQTFMRGIQMTDENGRAEFHTIYPGWYPGRITHVHFQVFLNSVLSATSQACFPDALNTTVYNTPTYASKGQNTSVANNAADGVFQSPPNDLQYELFTIVGNAAGDGYDATLTVGINGPTSGILDLEPETGGQFKLFQNSPNPFRDSTRIEFQLTSASLVQIDVYDVNGEKVAVVLHKNLSAGTHVVEWNRHNQLGVVAAGTYLYQLSTTNSSGQFRQAKVMTIL